MPDFITNFDDEAPPLEPWSTQLPSAARDAAIIDAIKATLGQGSTGAENTITDADGVHSRVAFDDAIRHCILPQQGNNWDDKPIRAMEIDHRKAKPTTRSHAMAVNEHFFDTQPFWGYTADDYEIFRVDISEPAGRIDRSAIVLLITHTQRDVWMLPPPTFQQTLCVIANATDTSVGIRRVRSKLDGGWEYIGVVTQVKPQAGFGARHYESLLWDVQRQNVTPNNKTIFARLIRQGNSWVAEPIHKIPAKPKPEGNFATCEL